MTSDSLIALQNTLKILREKCQWTSVQSPQSIAHFTIEEAYELYDAIQGEDSAEVEKELADLLYHLVFYIELYPHLSLEQIA